jgi:hypothetical protein
LRLFFCVGHAQYFYNTSQLKATKSVFRLDEASIFLPLEGTEVREPLAPWARPSAENLEFHFNAIFLR